MNQKQASSQAAWALLTEGVTSARVETHRVQHLMNRAQRLIDASEHKEQIYQLAGDLILAMPQRLEHMATILDRTGLALSKMGSEFLEARLPLSDKVMVDEAIEAAFGRGSPHESMATRVATRYLKKKVGRGE